MAPQPITGGTEPMTEKIGGMDAWEVRNAADTLMQAEEIKTMKPKLYKLAKAEALKKAKLAVKVAHEKKTRAELIANTKVKLDKL